MFCDPKSLEDDYPIHSNTLLASTKKAVTKATEKIVLVPGVLHCFLVDLKAKSNM